MKKAGIILGIFFIVIAILLCVFGMKYINKSDDVSDSDPNSSLTNEVVETPVQNSNTPNVGEQSDIQNLQGNVTQQPNIPTESQSNSSVGGTTTVVEKVITKEVSGVMTINEGDLGQPISTKEVIVHITNKRIMMIDEDTESTAPKMLTYCFDVLTPENMKLTLFVTNVVYTNYNVGDMLKVSYQIYQNDKGIQFPLVQNVLEVSN